MPEQPITEDRDEIVGAPGLRDDGTINEYLFQDFHLWPQFEINEVCRAIVLGRDPRSGGVGLIHGLYRLPYELRHTHVWHLRRNVVRNNVTGLMISVFYEMRRYLTPVEPQGTVIDTGFYSDNLAAFTEEICSWYRSRNGFSTSSTRGMVEYIKQNFLTIAIAMAKENGTKSPGLQSARFYNMFKDYANEYRPPVIDWYEIARHFYQLYLLDMPLDLPLSSP